MATPITFKECNVTYAKDQPDYLQLPAYKDKEGCVLSCWKLTLKERVMLLFTGRLWWGQLSFNRPLQPQRPFITKPEIL